MENSQSTVILKFTPLTKLKMKVESICTVPYIIMQQSNTSTIFQFTHSYTIQIFPFLEPSVFILQSENGHQLTYKVSQFVSMSKFVPFNFKLYIYKREQQL